MTSRRINLKALKLSLSFGASQCSRWGSTWSTKVERPPCLLYNIYSLLVAFSQLKQLKASCLIKQVKGTKEVTLNLAVRDRKRNFSRQPSKLSLWIIRFHKSQSILITLPLEVWSHCCKLSEEAVLQNDWTLWSSLHFCDYTRQLKAADALLLLAPFIP